MPFAEKGATRTKKRARNPQPSAIPGSELPRLSHNAQLSVTVAFVGSKQPTNADLLSAERHGALIASETDTRTREQLVPLSRRRGLWDVGDGHREVCAPESSKQALWRTAGLAYPCTCTLPIYRHVYTPQCKPPLSKVLSRDGLSDISDQTPLVGDELQPWSKARSEQLDLDPSLDKLEEFQPGWRRALLGKGKAKCRLESPRVMPPLSPTKVPQVGAFQQSNVSNKRKGPADRGLPAQRSVSTSLILAQRQRKGWWRAKIRADPIYGSVHTILPRSIYPSRPKRGKEPDRSRRDAFVLPKNMCKLSHPFHPDISYYCKHARTRVYWLIPVHGPVIVPRLADPVLDDNAQSWASRAELVASDRPFPQAAEGEKPKRPCIVYWTRELLQHFMYRRFEPLWLRGDRPYGPLHLAVSGPKPEPELDLPPPPPLDDHACLPPCTPALSAAPSSGDPIDVEASQSRPSSAPRRLPPVRVEAGDHIRLYCDADRALSLRTWLHWWEVDTSSLGDRVGCSDITAVGQAQQQQQHKLPIKLRPFERARFALIGPRQEVLMVA